MKTSGFAPPNHSGDTASFFTTAAACVFLAFLLTGCAAPGTSDTSSDIFTWYKSGQPAKSQEWVTVANLNELRSTCNVTAALDACSYRRMKTEGGQHCVVYSRYPEAEAKARKYLGSSYTLWDHEMKHCEGFSHREASLPIMASLFASL